MYLTDKITAGQMNISDRQDNSCTNYYKHQTDKITAGQLNVFIRQTRQQQNRSAGTIFLYIFNLYTIF